MTKEQFDKLYVREKIAVHCDTEEKAINFLKLADKFGYRWTSGDSLKLKTNYDRYGNETCYDLILCQFCRKEFYKQENYKIIKFQPNPKDLLEDGFKVVYRDEKERFVLARTLHDYLGKKQKSINDYDDQLVDKDGYKAMDIMEIYNREDELIWKREEKSERDFEIERIEKEMRKLADDLQRLKEVE